MTRNVLTDLVDWVNDHESIDFKRLGTLAAKHDMIVIILDDPNEFQVKSRLGYIRISDMETGKQMWTTRPYGKYWSMVSDGKRILALDSGGTLYLLNANPDKFDLVDSRKVSDSSTWAHLATIDGYVCIRSLDKLISLRWAKTSDSP